MKAVGPSGRRGLNEIAGRAASNALKKYHFNFNVAGGWRVPPGGGGSDFGEMVVRGWGLPKATSSGVVITNAAPHYAWKIKGGVIRPKRVKSLTIPLVPEARGRFVKTYERVSGNKLFRAAGTNILAEKDDSAKGFRAVYALVKKVTQKPTPGALPNESVYVTPFIESLSKQIARKLRG